MFSATSIFMKQVNEENTADSDEDFFPEDHAEPHVTKIEIKNPVPI